MNTLTDRDADHTAYGMAWPFIDWKMYGLLAHVLLGFMGKKAFYIAHCLSCHDFVLLFVPPFDQFLYQ